MFKDLGVQPYTFPMPVLLIATYNEDGSVDVMNMAWGGVCAENMVALNLDEDHKTSRNLKARGAFTLSIADLPHIKEADFFGIASGNKMKDKFERSGLHAHKSARGRGIFPHPGVQGRRMSAHGVRLPGPRGDRQRAGRRKSAGRKGQGGPRQAERLCVRPLPERLLCGRRKGRTGLAHRGRTGQKVILFAATDRDRARPSGSFRQKNGA